MIYLDCAATTHKHPKQVVKSVVKTIKNSANPGRGGHDLSAKAGFEVFSCRDVLNQFFGGYGIENVILTSSCTQALNLAILGSAKSGGHIVATVWEHNSVLRPLAYLQSQGIISFSLATPNKNGNIDASCIEKELKPNTYMIITSHISNVSGAKANINEIGTLAKSKNLIYLVDGAQSAGHEKINLKKSKISMFATPSHKGLMGICGSGALLLSPSIKLKPINFGGTGTSSISLDQPTTPPEAFESGTLPTPAISSMKSGALFIAKRQEKIKKHIEKLSQQLIDGLKSIKNVVVYTKIPTGVVSFNVKDLPSTDVASVLNDKYKICTRAGLHCAPLAHKFLGTQEQGCVRASVDFFTKKSEIKKLIEAIREISE